MNYFVNVPKLSLYNLKNKLFSSGGVLAMAEVVLPAYTATAVARSASSEWVSCGFGCILQREWRRFAAILFLKSGCYPFVRSLPYT
ncbi:hypothetical protein MNBD_GAMMA13-1302 [hydrothermal vent metagenome]|uniref:Uncharacterized protein n=1 Tax=hydrothermal vent metagenome TaxID=652676 RepID=A0A3B0YXH9_9ZZZZ